MPPITNATCSESYKYRSEESTETPEEVCAGAAAEVLSSGHRRNEPPAKMRLFDFEDLCYPTLDGRHQKLDRTTSG